MNLPSVQSTFNINFGTQHEKPMNTGKKQNYWLDKMG